MDEQKVLCEMMELLLEENLISMEEMEKARKIISTNSFRLQDHTGKKKEE